MQFALFLAALRERIATNHAITVQDVVDLLDAMANAATGGDASVITEIAAIDGDVQALLTRVAALEAELATLKTTPAQPQ